jgi:gamma-glutamyltranspeptidase/glutathione hydrolase
MLNILEGYDIRGMGFGSAQYLHTLIETKKVTYEDRARYYADPEFYIAPIDQLISKEYAAERRALIAGDRAADTYPAGDAVLENGDTIYLSIADKDGNMVSFIQSNYGDLGSGMTPGNLGFMLQNRGQLFSLREGHANVYEPGKRPFHTIIPAFVMKDGKPWLSFGVMGGSMQPQAHAQIIVNLIDFDMNLQEAGDAARMRHTGSSQPTDQRMSDGGTVYLESDIPESVREQLREMGHNISTSPISYGGYQAVMWNEEQGVYYGASESRKDGQAAGY